MRTRSLHRTRIIGLACILSGVLTTWTVSDDDSSDDDSSSDDSSSSRLRHVVSDMRVAKVEDLVETAGNSSTGSSRVAIIMFLSEKKHFRVQEGDSFEPVDDHVLKFASTRADGSIVLEDARGAEVAIHPITESEKKAYLRRVRSERP